MPPLLPHAPWKRLALAAAVAAAGAWLWAQAPQFKITVQTNEVLVNFTATDSSGHVVRDLKPSDITVLEDGKPQHLDSFNFENVDQPPLPATAAAGPNGAIVKGQPAPAKSASAAASPAPASPSAYKDHRLIVLYFDLSTMQPEDLGNALDSATHFIQNQMRPADLVAIASLGNTLVVNQDFTADKDLLLRQINALNPTLANGFAAGDTGSSEGTADNGSSFTADDTEFNLANADRSLESIQSLCEMLQGIQQKKAVLYFSSGIQRSGVDNEITLRSAVNAAVRSDVSLYTMDARGLQALPAGGSASAGSIRGQSNFSGASQMNALNSQFSQQETISTLATDTGGKSFLDSNDLTVAYTAVENDTRSYYLVTYRSTNPAEDGKFRKIVVKVNRPGIKLQFRNGYYAPRDLAHLNAEDREQQLQDELTAATPDNSLDLYLNSGYLRLVKAPGGNSSYFVPVSVVVPGSEVPMTTAKPGQIPSVDFAGTVTDQLGRQLGHVRETVKLDAKTTGGNASSVGNRNLQYDSGFVLPPGTYQLRFAARENQTGHMGAFATVITVPDLSAQEAKSPAQLSVSSVLLGNQLAPAKPVPNDPLTTGGEALVPSVTHVFATNQTLYLYYEVYDPKLTGAGDQVALKTDVAFFRGRVKAWESQPISIERETDPQRGAAVIQMQIPLDKLAPGYYTCQINAVDDGARRFAFPRLPILVRGPATAANGK